jgi:hypothetical protein
MVAAMPAQARAHHYVPQCWLAGFTDSGQKDGRLWQTDVNAHRQWPTSPLNAGHQRDFYRVYDPSKDPLVIETKLSEMEGLIAPILQRLDQKRRLPDADELTSLIIFMAIQFIRVPAFRPLLFGITDSVIRSRMAEVLATPESWEQALRAWEIPAGAEGSDYQGMREFFQSGDFSLNLENENDWYLKSGFTAAADVMESLQKRYWGIAVSNAGDFIASDNPVVMDGCAGERMGFENAGVVIYPVSRHLVLYGTRTPTPIPPMEPAEVARHNTFMMMTASRYVYSHRDDFPWLDAEERIQTDVSLFSKSTFAAVTNQQ